MSSGARELWGRPFSLMRVGMPALPTITVRLALAPPRPQTAAGKSRPYPKALIGPGVDIDR